MQVEQQDLRRFQTIIDRYYMYTRFPKAGAWRRATNRELWLRMVIQVMVVGSSESARRLEADKDLQAHIDFTTLKRLQREIAIQRHLHTVLRQTGTRYVSEDPSNCHKTRALVHNFHFLREQRGGPKGLLRRLAAMEAERERVDYLMEYLHFLGHKSARDYLMSVGVNRQTLALDVRTQNIFRHLRLPFPSSAGLARRAVYEETEQAIVEAICTPLRIEPVALDRILYQHYQRIVGTNFDQLQLPF